MTVRPRPIREKAGGRKKGSVNKITKTVRDILAEVTSEYYNSEDFKTDIRKLNARDRVAAMEKLTAYIVPKMQSTTLDATVSTSKTIEDKLLELSQEEIE